MFCANFNFQTRPRACLEIAFRQVCVPLCGRFGPDEGGVAGYVDRIGTKYTAKWGVQMAGMNFQTRSNTTANKIVSFYGVTDRHNDSFLCDNIQFFAYRKTCTPSCYRTT